MAEIKHPPKLNLDIAGPNGVWLAFLDIQAPADGRSFKAVVLPVKYFGAGAPVAVERGSLVSYKLSAVSRYQKDGKEVDVGNTWWIFTLLSTLFGVLFAPLTAVLTSARNSAISELVRRVQERYPGIKFIVRDSQVPVHALNAVLDLVGAPNVSPVTLAQLREGAGVTPDRIFPMCTASLSMDAYEDTIEFADAIKLAQDFFNFMEPFVEAAASIV